MKLRKSEHMALMEALRRRTRFIGDPTGGRHITAAWTGLGSATYYKQAQEGGYMEIATAASSGFSTWWRLTWKGAVIVAFWIGQGFDYKTIEANKIPPAEIPETVLA